MYTTLPRDGCVLCMNTLFDVQLEVFPCRRRRRLNLFCQKSTRLSLVTALHLSVFFAFQCKEMQCDLCVHWSRGFADVEIHFRPFKWLKCLAVWGSSLFRGDLVCWPLSWAPIPRWHYRVTLENEDNKTWTDHDHYVAMFLFYYNTSKTCNQEKQTSERIVCHIGKADKLGGTNCFLRRTWSKSCTHSLQKGRLMSQCLAQYLFVLCRAEQMRIFMIF